MTTKTIKTIKTIENLWDADITSLRDAAGQAGDFVMVGICEVARDGSCDFDDYAAIGNDDRKVIKGYTRSTARQAVCDAINDTAAGR